MHNGEPIPYATLVRMGVIERRLDDLSNAFAGMRDEVGDTVLRLAGVFDAVKKSDLRDVLCDEWLEQFARDVDRRSGQDVGVGTNAD
jgi:hypothetical protein